MNEKPGSENIKTDEVEMSDFLKILGKVFTKIGNAIAWVFISLYELVILLFLFIKRKIVWLALGFLFGLAFGLYSYYNSGPVYSSEMVTRANFESNYFIYNQIEYFNSLIKNQRTAELVNEFNITEDEARSLVTFKVEPIKNNIEAAKLFRRTFLQNRRSHNYRFDTVWSKTLRFDDFKTELTDYDYPVNKITVQAKKLDVFPKIQQGILNSFNNNPDLKEKKQSIQQIRKQEESLLADILKNIDTLRQVYNKKLTLQAENPSTGGNQFILGERDIRNPELDLYDKSMIIKDELIELKMKSAEETEALDLYSGFGKIGTQDSTIRSVGKMAIYGMAFIFILLIGIEFIKFLNRTEKIRKRSKQDSNF